MASNLSLGYHQLLETEKHNRITEAETVRANNLLDAREYYKTDVTAATALAGQKNELEKVRLQGQNTLANTALSAEKDRLNTRDKIWFNNLTSGDWLGVLGGYLGYMNEHPDEFTQEEYDRIFSLYGLTSVLNFGYDKLSGSASVGNNLLKGIGSLAKFFV